MNGSESLERCKRKCSHRMAGSGIFQVYLQYEKIVNIQRKKEDEKNAVSIYLFNAFYFLVFRSFRYFSFVGSKPNSLQ